MINFLFQSIMAPGSLSFGLDAIQKASQKKESSFVIITCFLTSDQPFPNFQIPFGCVYKVLLGFMHLSEYLNICKQPSRYNQKTDSLCKPQNAFYWENNLGGNGYQFRFSAKYNTACNQLQHIVLWFTWLIFYIILLLYAKALKVILQWATGTEHRGASSRTQTGTFILELTKHKNRGHLRTLPTDSWVHIQEHVFNFPAVIAAQITEALQYFSVSPLFYLCTFH